MSFLAEYNAIPATEPRLRISCCYKWLRTDWRGMFAELRKDSPVFVNPAFAMVTRHADVIDVLSQPTLFSVRGYALKMDPSVGPFMLARDETEINWNEKGLLRALLRWDDLAAVRKLAGEVARASIDAAADPLDLVPAVGRLVPLKVVQKYFGFEGPDDATMLRWSKATQSDMFRNPINDPTVHAAGVAAGNEMRAWISARIAGDGAPPDTVFSRLITTTVSGQPALNPERMASNVAGLLVGAIETTSQAIVQAAQQLLMRTDIRGQVDAAARAQDPAAFDALVWEALRFNPITGLVFRFTERDTVLAPGAPYETAIKAGTIVAACTGSAGFDADVIDAPDEFRPGRPDAVQFHLGFGHHECVGKHVGIQMVPEAVRQIVLTPGIALIDGPDGQIDFTGSAFPEHFRVRRPGQNHGGGLNSAAAAAGS
jgi:cytochrome P450